MINTPVVINGTKGTTDENKNIIMNPEVKNIIKKLPDTGLNSLVNDVDDSENMAGTLIISLVALLGLKKLLRRK